MTDAESRYRKSWAVHWDRVVAGIDAFKNGGFLGSADQILIEFNVNEII